MCIRDRFKVDLAVIGASAVDSDGDLLDYDLAEVRVSRAILDTARAAWWVADASKFARVAPVSYTHLDVYKRQALCKAAVRSATPSCGKSPPGSGTRAVQAGFIGNSGASFAKASSARRR